MEWKSGSPCLSHKSPHREEGPLEGTTAGSQSLGIVEQSQGEGCCWLQRGRSRVCEEGDHGGKHLWSKARQPQKQGDTAESCVGGGPITITSLSRHTSISSWTNAWGADLRGGPHPGAPLWAWGADLRRRTPPRCLSVRLRRWSEEEDPSQVPLCVPEAPICGGGPQPGAPLCAWGADLRRRTQPGGIPSMCLTSRATEKDPRQGSPLRA